MQPDERILAGSAATISGELYDQDGDLTAPSGTVTVAVSAADGTEVLAAGTATTSTETGIHTVVIPAADTAALGVLTAVWTDDGDGSTATTYHEIVGGFYASLADMKAADAALNDPTKYPNSRMCEARWQVETEFEGICGQAFVPRYRRVRVTSEGSAHLVLPDPFLRSVRSVRAYSTATSYTTVDVSGVPADDSGIARLITGCWPTGELVVEYEHGHNRPPRDILGAFRVRLRDVLNRDRRGVPDRTSSFTSAENGTFALIVPGQRGSVTGIPDVDVVLARHARYSVGIA